MGNLFLPKIAYTFAKPTRGHNFLLGVKLHAFFSLDVEVAIKGIIPAGKGKHRHRSRHTDVDPDHAGFDASLNSRAALPEFVKIAVPLP